MSSTPPPPPPPPPGGDQGSPGATGDPAASAPSGGGPAFGPADGGDARERNSMALTALILGLIAFPGVLLLAFVPLVNVLTIATPLVAIAAIVFGIIGIRRAKRPAIDGGVGMGVTGIVLGAINLLLTAALVAGSVMFLRACPEVLNAATPDQFMEQALECAEEQGALAPEDVDQLEGELEEELRE